MLLILSLFSSAYLAADETAFGTVIEPLETHKFLEVIDGHIISLRNKNLAKAYHAFTSQEFKKHTSFETFESIIKKFPPLFDNESIELFTINYVEEAAYYLGRICSKDSDALMIEYEMISEKGHWKINSFSLRKIISNKK